MVEVVGEFELKKMIKLPKKIKENTFIVIPKKQARLNVKKITLLR